MTEIDNTVDETAEDVNEGAAETAAEEAETAEDNSQEESDAAEDSAADEEEGAQDEDEDAEPPTRKPRTNADWVALRRQQKLDKQKAGKDEQGEDENDSDEEDDDINSEDAKLIDKVVSKRLEPFEKATQLAEVKSEIDEFVAKNPDFKPFAAKALKWSQHPSWKDVPTKQLMHAAAGDKLLAIGAKRAKAAIAKANKTKTGSNSGGDAGGKKAVSEMTDEEFENEILRVKTGGGN